MFNKFDINCEKKNKSVGSALSVPGGLAAVGLGFLYCSNTALPGTPAFFVSHLHIVQNSMSVFPELVYHLNPALAKINVDADLVTNL